MLSFKGATALVTGAGSGLGAAMSRRLATEGCNLILTGRDINALEKTKTECERYGIDAYIRHLDLEDFSSIDSLYDFIKEKRLNINLFVLNAGISQRAKTLETSFDVDRKIMQVDYFGAVYLIKKFGDELKTSKQTSIAVTTSLAGLFGFPLRSAYCAAKSALIGFFETLGLEYPNIDVTLLIPGRINTEISRKAIIGDGNQYGKMDKGQADGMDVDKAASKAVKAIKRRRHRKLIGGTELLMAYINKFLPCVYYKVAGKISAT